MKTLYLFAAVAGTVVPWIFFGGFISEHGIDLTLFVAMIFATKPAGGFAADLLIYCAVFWIWSWRDARARFTRLVAHDPGGLARRPVPRPAALPLAPGA